MTFTCSWFTPNLLSGRPEVLLPAKNNLSILLLRLSTVPPPDTSRPPQSGLCSFTSETSEHAPPPLSLVILLTAIDKVDILTSDTFSSTRCLFSQWLQTSGSQVVEPRDPHCLPYHEVVTPD